MLVRLTERAFKELKATPLQIQKLFRKQARLLASNIRHPSLHAKKYDEGQDLWQARITRDWRFYFLISRDVYLVLTINRHPK